jgi:single-strand DNA-binding protein
MAINKVILVGNLGKDPELRYTPSGVAVASFSLATSERFKDRNGEQQERTEWHNIVVWRQLAEICGKYLHKGKQVYLEGKIQTRKYQDRDGNDRYITEVVCHEMQMLGNRSEGDSQPSQSRSDHGSQSQAQGQPQQKAANSGAGFGDFEEPPFDPDEDIPF